MKPIIVVMGMNRSGTSLVCQALERLGVSFGSPLIEPDEANVRGYYEHKDLVHHQTILVHTCYDRRGWNDIGELVELDGKVEAIETQLYEIEEVLMREVEANELFGVKLPLLQRIPSALGAVMVEVSVQPIYIHAMRTPMEVYASVLKANNTWDKNTRAAYRGFLRKWAWANGELFKYEPACEVWYEQWFENADATMKRLAEAVGRETVSTEGLLL